MVKFLAWYINNRNRCPGGSYLVNIEAEIDKYKNKNPNKTPTIIFDFVSSTTIFIKDEKEILSAGRQMLCTYRAEEFCQRFKKLGVNLVFFIDGPIKEFKYSLWLQRVNDKYERQNIIFENLRNGEPINMRYTGQMLSSYFENVLAVARKYGKIYVSFHNECDIDLAAYATKVHATGVFAMDTDFLIMPGDWPIWSPKNFDFETFQTTAWNKKSLRLALDLKQNQMPIFSILSGNDWIPYEKVQHILEMVSGDLQQERLAELIRRHFPNGVNLKKTDFDKLVSFIYNAGKNVYTQQEAKKLVQMSLDFYDYRNHNIPKIQPEWLEKHIEKTSSSLIYMLVKELPFTIHQSFIDLSKVDVQPYAELALPIVRRQMGLAYYNKRMKPDFKTIICFKPSHEEPYQRREFSPLYPEKYVPSFPVLLGYETESGDEKLTVLRKFEIFCWMISPRKGKLNAENILKLSETFYMIPALVLYYLVKQIQITVEEADVVLLTIFEAIKSSPEKLSSIKPPELYEERPFWIAFIFVRLTRMFNDCMIVCGLFDYIKPGCFDGFIFHKMYKKFLSMERDEKQVLIKDIEEYRLYVK